MDKLNVTAIVLILGSLSVFGVYGRPQAEGIFEVDGFVFDGPADRSNTNSVDIGPPPSPTESVPTNNTPPSAQLNDCTQACLTTSEFNPVCGTDGVVYSNPGRLSCAQRCGKDVRMLYFGPCTTSNARG